MLTPLEPLPGRFRPVGEDQDSDLGQKLKKSLLACMLTASGSATAALRQTADQSGSDRDRKCALENTRGSE